MHGITLCARLADTEQSPTVFSGISVYSHFFGSVQGFYLVALDHAAVSETFGTDLNDPESTSDFFDFMREALNVSCGQAIPFLEPMFGQLTYSPSVVVNGQVHFPDYATCHLDLILPGDHILQCAVFLDLAEVKIGAELLQTRKALEESSLTAQSDRLTQLYNRHFFDSTYANLVITCIAKNDSCSAIWIDADHFKEINDQHGHIVGDSALKHIAAAIHSAIRTTDLAFRYGGDEFVLVLPGAPSGAATRISQRIAQYLRDHTMSTPKGQSLTLGLSIGVASLRPSDTPTTLLQRADLQLYQAKERGRGCVACDTETSCEES